MVYLGASIAGSIRIGNAMGSGDTHRAKLAAFLVLALGTLLSIMNISLLIFFRDKLPYIFTNDEDLVKKAEELFLVVALFQLPGKHIIFVAMKYNSSELITNVFCTTDALIALSKAYSERQGNSPWLRSSTLLLITS